MRLTNRGSPAQPDQRPLRLQESYASMLSATVAEVWRGLFGAGMTQPSRFVPSSYDAFRRSAKDLQRAYNLPLQRSQEALARIYGYPDLYALQNHLKQSPEGGPFDHELSYYETVGRNYRANDALSAFLGSNKALAGHLEASDLMLFAEPKIRRAQMDFERQLAEAASRRNKTVDLASVSEYMSFEIQEPSLILGTRKKEGLFRLTPKGIAIERLVTHYLTDISTPDDHFEVLKHLSAISSTFHCDPVSRIEVARMLHQDTLIQWENTESIEADQVQLTLDCCEMVKSELESLMPKAFSGLIEPNLSGDQIQNEPYMTALSIGMECAYLLNKVKVAKAWGLKYLKHHPNDSFGVRFILKKIDTE